MQRRIPLSGGRRRSLTWVAVLGGLPILSGFISLALGRHVSFDLLNYHFYNAYAFLHDRLNYDIAPAGFQTYWNPAMDLPVYWMMRHLSSRWVGFLLGRSTGYLFRSFS